MVSVSSSADEIRQAQLRHINDYEREQYDAELERLLSPENKASYEMRAELLGVDDPEERNEIAVRAAEIEAAGNTLPGRISPFDNRNVVEDAIEEIRAEKELAQQQEPPQGQAAPGLSPLETEQAAVTPITESAPAQQPEAELQNVAMSHDRRHGQADYSSLPQAPLPEQDVPLQPEQSPAIAAAWDAWEARVGQPETVQPIAQEGADGLMSDFVVAGQSEPVQAVPPAPESGLMADYVTAAALTSQDSQHTAAPSGLMADFVTAEAAQPGAGLEKAQTADNGLMSDFVTAESQAVAHGQEQSRIIEPSRVQAGEKEADNGLMSDFVTQETHEKVAAERAEKQIQQQFQEAARENTM